MKTVTTIGIALVLLAAVGCASDQSVSDRRERAVLAIEACRDNGGVAAFDDDSVICGDQTFHEARGERAVAACRGHGGVSGFDDDIVICRDQTFHVVEE